MHTLLKIHIVYFCLNRHLFRSRRFFNKDIRYTTTFWMSDKGQLYIQKGNSFFFFSDLFFLHFLHISTHLYHCFLILGNSTIYTEIQRTCWRSDIKFGPRAIILRQAHFLILYISYKNVSLRWKVSSSNYYGLGAWFLKYWTCFLLNLALEVFGIYEYILF